MRAAGLVCLGAGAGLIRGDLREVRGTDVACRSGGVIVTVRGARPRTVPVLARYHARLLAAARVRRDRAGLRRGRSRPPELTNPLITALDGGTGLPRLDTSRLRATWLADCAELWGWPRSCTPPGSAAPSGSATWSPGWAAGEAEAVRLLGARPAMIPLAAFEEIIDASGVAPRIEACCPSGCAPGSCRSAPCWPGCA